MHVEQSAELPATVTEAWDVLTDWERQSEWMRDADRVEVLGTERHGHGVRLAVRTRVFNVPAFTERLDVVEWDPPRRLRIAHRSFVRGFGEWRLDPVTGGVRFTWSEHLTLPAPVVGELALQIYRPYLRRLIGKAQEGFRRTLIARGPSRA
jgi:polyketide cyclase/dehydrase/lipid transport protein